MPWLLTRLMGLGKTAGAGIEKEAEQGFKKSLAGTPNAPPQRCLIGFWAFVAGQLFGGETIFATCSRRVWGGFTGKS
jgi:hypothetical protein